MSAAASKKSKSKSADKVPAVKSPRERLDEIGIEALCAFVSGGENSCGESLSAFCRAHGLAVTTVNEWIDDPSQPSRAESYARAREARADNYFESLDDVSTQAVNASDAVQVAGLRLKADNIKWKLARMHRKYSDRTVLAGDPEAPLKHSVTVLDPESLSKLSTQELEAAIAAAEKLNGQN
jgi:hypothetical protein